MRIVRYLVWVALLPAGLAEAAEPSWALPEDPQAVVIELRVAEQRQLSSSVPAHSRSLRIQRCGEVVLRDSGAKTDIGGRLAESELRNLLDDIVDRQRMLELTTDSLTRRLSAEAERTGKDWRVRNAPIASVRIALAGATHSFDCPTPDLLRTRFPGVEELIRVCAILHRLQNVAAVAQVGGPQEAERLAALATAELKRQNGTNMRITPRDLLNVRGAAGDLRQVQFVVDPELRGEQGSAIHISVMESSGAAPRVSMTPIAKPL
ncbi:MAG: hypothetical protein U0992_04710 [Planctomycetaceae bacterium]